MADSNYITSDVTLSSLELVPLSTDIATQAELSVVKAELESNLSIDKDDVFFKSVGGIVSGDGLSVFQNSLGVLSGNFIQSNSENVLNYSSKNAFLQAEEAGSDAKSYGPAYTGTKGFCILSVDRVKKELWLSGNISSLVNLYDGTKTSLSDRYAGTFPINSRALRIYEGNVVSRELTKDNLSNLYYSFALSSGSGTRFRISAVEQCEPDESDPILSNGYGIARLTSLPAGLTAVPANVAMNTYIALWNNDDNALYCPGFPEIGNVIIENFYAQHGEGGSVRAIGKYTHVEGRDTIADVRYSHAEGSHNVAGEMASHAEGFYTLALARYTHAEGNATSAINQNAHSEGNMTLASGTNAHAEGKYTEANGEISHAEGLSSIAGGSLAHVEGYQTSALAFTAMHAEGYRTLVSANNGHAEGYRSKSFGAASHAEGANTVAGNGFKEDSINDETIGKFSHSEGNGVFARGNSSHAEGKDTQALGYISHTEGNSTIATGYASHAEGGAVSAVGRFSHAEGYSTIALSANDTNNSNAHGTHAEGVYTQAGINALSSHWSGTGIEGTGAHAEGYGTGASRIGAHAEGYITYANGVGAHTEGMRTFALNQAEHAQGQYNISHKLNSTFGSPGNTLHSIGMGKISTDCKNAVEVMQDGKTFVYGVGGYDGTNPTSTNVKDLVGVVNDITITLNDISTDLSNYVSANTEYIQIGKNARVANNALSGIAIGAHAIVVNSGVAIGKDSHANNNGIAIGMSTEANSSETVAIGKDAKVATNTSGAVQIGSGTNDQENSFQFRSTEIVNSNGKIPHNNLDINLENTFTPLSGGLIPNEGQYPTLVVKGRSYINDNELVPTPLQIQVNETVYDMNPHYAVSTFYNVSSVTLIPNRYWEHFDMGGKLNINSVPMLDTIIITHVSGDTKAAPISFDLDTNTVIRIDLNITCLAPDTEILMSDFKTTKQLKDLKPGDEIAAFDPYDNTKISDIVMEVYKGKGTKTDIWTFDDGTVIKTVGRHRFYNADIQEMLYLEAWNLGEEAVNSNKRRTKLIKHECVEGSADYATLFTEKYNNYFANGLLAGNRRSVKLFL